MKYKPSQDLLEFAREHKTLSPTKLAQLVLNRRNEKITPESVTMWFKRHPAIHQQLAKELVERLPTEKEKVDASIFERKQFEELSSVKAWLLEMKNRDLTNNTIVRQKSNLRDVCMGKFPKLHIDLVAEGKWSYKHPDRLTLQDAMEIIAILRDRKIDTYLCKRVLKDFLMSKGIVIGKKIAVGKPKGFGKMAWLFVERPILNQMLWWVKEQNFEAYVVDDFMFKTGTRIRATLKSLIESVDFQQHTIKVYEKARHSLYPEGKQWIKYIPSKLWKNMMQLVRNRKSGKIFQNVTYQDLAKINRKALNCFVPYLSTTITFPNHFWRHMCIQHLLRVTDWNYAVVSELVGSTVASLQESYGKPPEAIVRQWGLKYMPTLEKSEEMAPMQTIKSHSLRRRKA
jgi:hypothetical protein